MSSNKVIALRGQPIVDEQLQASAAITPGDLIEVNSGKWRRNANAAKNAIPAFALERDELGKGIDSTAGDYAANDYVKAGFFHAGQRVNAFIGSGQATTAYVTFLESAGDGTLRALATDAATDDTQRVSVVAVAVETVSTVTAKTRVAVQLL